MNPVLVKNGTFAALLGNGNPITADVLQRRLLLEIKVGTNAPIAPRQRTASVAYALKPTPPGWRHHHRKIADGAITAAKLALSVGGGVPLATSFWAIPRPLLQVIPSPAKLSSMPLGSHKPTSSAETKPPCLRDGQWQNLYHWRL